MSVQLPDPYVGGPVADSDPRETLKERFDGTQRNFEKIRQLLVDTGGESVGLRFGKNTVATPGAATFFDVTVDHGLGRTPVAVVATPDNGNYHAAITALSSTQATIRLSHTLATSTDPGDFNVYWVALG